MDQEHVHEVMNHIDPALIEAMDAGKKGRIPRMLRTGLIAACVCLALVGTAFAAGAAYRLMVQVFHSEDYTGYTLSGDVTAYPLDEFSPALLEASETWEGQTLVQQDFSTWEETQAFLGSSIPCAWPDGIDWDGSFHVTLYQEEETRQLVGVAVYSVTGHASITLRIYVDEFSMENGPIYSLLDNPAKEIEQLDSYPMLNGAVAKIILDHGTAESSRCTAAGYFVKAGILYEVSTYSSAEAQSEALSQLRDILDSFA